MESLNHTYQRIGSNKETEHIKLQQEEKDASSLQPVRVNHLQAAQHNASNGYLLRLGRKRGFTLACAIVSSGR